MRERNIDGMPPALALTEDQTHNLGMCRDQGWNPQTFGVRHGAPTHGATRPGPCKPLLVTSLHKAAPGAERFTPLSQFEIGTPK